MANALAQRDENHTPVMLVVDSSTDEIVELETSMFAGTGSSVTVVDNLSSTSKTSALSANQGKVLNDKVATKTGTETLTNKTIDAGDNTIVDLELSNFKSGVLQTEVRDVSNAKDTSISSELAIRTELDKKTSISEVYPQGSVYSTSLDKEASDIDTLFGGTWEKLGITKTIALKASGTITLDDNLEAGDTITIGSEVLEADTDFDIGTDKEETAEKIAEVVVSDVELSAEDNVITVTAKNEGEDGNDIALDTSSEDVTLSGETLTGGADEKIINHFTKT